MVVAIDGILRILEGEMNAITTEDVQAEYEQYGTGTYSVVLELNTQSPPFLNDSDEEIVVSVEVVMFKPTATAV